MTINVGMQRIYTFSDQPMHSEGQGLFDLGTTNVDLDAPFPIEDSV